ncbi:MAG: hypothetical protein PWP31_1576 [Clostridia bacterium]|nr:hypothetical protein [Clostridia bacterium]
MAIETKKIETMSWKTKYRGPLAIHATKNMPVYAKDLCRTEPFKTILSKNNIIIEESNGFVKFDKAKMPIGAIVATCKLVDCWLITSDNIPKEPERFGWILEDIKTLPEPVPAKGRQRLWEWVENVPSHQKTIWLINK